MATRRSNRTRGRGHQPPRAYRDPVYRARGALGARLGGSRGAAPTRLGGPRGSDYMDQLATRYHFNGSDTRIVIPDWRPLGLPWSMEAKVSQTGFNVGASDGIVTGDFGQLYSHSAAGNIGGMYRRATDNSSQHIAGAGNVINQGPHMIRGTADPAAVYKISVHDLDGTELGDVLGDTVAGTGTDTHEISTIGSGASASPDVHFEGWVWDVWLNDYSPLQNRYYMPGDGARHATLDTPIILEANSDWEISLVARRDAPGTGDNDRLLGVTGADFELGLQEFRIAVYAQDADPVEEINRIAVRAGAGGTSKTFNGALDNIDYGQQYTLRLRNTASDGLQCWVDGVKHSVNHAYLPDKINIGEFYRSAAAGTLGVGSYIADVQVEDLKLGRRWFYSLNNLGDDAIINTGNVPGHHGAWSSVDWQFQANNSRHYPINLAVDDIDAGTARNILDPSGDTDGTFANYDPSLWRALP